jgi:hypothetical protein
MPVNAMPLIEPTATRTSELLVRTHLSPSGGRTAVDDPRWLLAQRISISKSIGRSPLLSEFLLYVCDRHIRNKSSELTEQQIGVHVFGRREGYNSNDDNIVRNYARTLRKRVEEYFATEGRHEDLKLEIPRGAYVPVFYSRSQGKPPRHEIPQSLMAPSPPSAEAVSSLTDATTQEPSPLPAEHSVPDRVSRLRYASYPIGALCMMLIGIGLYLLMHSYAPVDAARSQPLSDVLWSQLFQKNRDTFIVPADAGLVIMQGFTREPVSLGEYASGSYRSKATSLTGVSKADVQELGGRRYTSVVDLNIVSHLSRLKQIVPERMMIRYARDLRMDDLRSSNAILLGSMDADPWAGLFQDQINFRFSYDPKSDTSPVILNLHPLAGEERVYANDRDGAQHDTFGTIAYQLNLDGTGHVLLLGGQTMAGTQAAADFVLDPALMQPVLEHAMSPDGTIRSFEILIETNTIAATASRPHMVSERTGHL